MRSGCVFGSGDCGKSIFDALYWSGEIPATPAIRLPSD
jgi:hypothetical protein